MDAASKRVANQACDRNREAGVMPKTGGGYIS